MPTHFLQQFGSFSDIDIKRFEQSVSIFSVTKGTHLLKKGTICKEVYFIIEGSFIQYSIKNEIDQQIIDLHLPNEWMLNQQSFVQQKPSETYIEAYSNSIVYVLTVEKMHELIQISPTFFQLGKVLEPVSSRVQLFDQQLNPKEKYKFVLSTRPILLQVFPLKVIASYLKITPETLSRVREKMMKQR